MTHRSRPYLVLAAIAVASLLLLAQSTYSAYPVFAAPNAGTVTVYSTADDGSVGTLRQALATAIDGETIDFNIGSCPCTITLTAGELLVDKSVTIQGPGADKLTISGNNSSRVFNVSLGTAFRAPQRLDPTSIVIGSSIGTFLRGLNAANRKAAATVLGPTVGISGVTITAGSGANGGGIYNEGTLTLDDVAITSNAASGNGGGIYNADGATVTVSHALIAHNAANGSFGGGLANIGDSRATLTNVTMSDNSAADDGGAIYNNDNNISNNTNSVSLLNVTITGNHTPSDAAGIDNFGGISGTGGVFLENTIIAGNTAPGLGPDCRNPFGHPIVSRGNNLIGNNANCTFTTQTGDIVGTSSNPIDPRLGVLMNYGGPTESQAPLPGSAAENNGNDAACPADDQRGIPRPQSIHCEIGAIEDAVNTSGDSFNVWNVKVNGSYAPVTVNPGDTVTLTYDFHIWSGPCPDCIVQLLSGIDGTHAPNCGYDGGTTPYPGQSGSDSETLTAPNSPGTYYFRIIYTQEYNCDHNTNPLAPGIGTFEQYNQNWQSLSQYATLIVSGSGSTVVTNTNDDGPGSLRQAIGNANDSEGGETISFNIPGSGVQTIALASPLPVLQSPMTIDGLTQPGASATNLLITLDGTNVGTQQPHGLFLDTGDSTVRGLIIQNFQGNGILVGDVADNDLIEHNRIINNSLNGISLIAGEGSAERIHISENSISGNHGLGIDLNDDGATANDVGDADGGANGSQNSPALLIASPSGNDVVLKGRLNSQAEGNYTLEFFANTGCSDTAVSQGETFLSSASASADAQGNLYFSTTLSNVPANSFITATATDLQGNTSEFSTCIPITANNQSWVNAQFLNIPCPDPNDPPPAQSSDTQTEYLVQPDQARWFKFCVTPRSKIIITLTQLPDDFDLTMFKDIGAQYQQDVQNLTNTTQATSELNKLSAEFAPDAFSPDAFSPDAFSPEAFSPDAFSPDAFSPDAFSPDAFSPDAFSPDAFSPDAYSPDAFSPDAFSPDAFSPDAFSPDAFSPDAYSPDAFSPDAFSSAQTRSIIGVSAFPGTASEGLVLNTWDNTGNFYIRVRGKNGAYNPNAPFKITVTELTGACGSVGLPTVDTSLNGATNKSALILWDRDRMVGTTAQKDALKSRMNDLAAATNGVVVDVGDDAKVAQMNTQADAHPDCPFAKNLVASAIKDVINKYDANKNLNYIVLVGNDDALPFFRAPDQSLLANESNYTPPVKDNTPLQSALRLGYVLTQDPYGARTSLSLGTNTFAVPEIAVGRLVETATEATGMIDAYLAGNGHITTNRGALVTGYDFLADAAGAIKDQLNAGMNQTATTLIAPNNLAPGDPQSWHADDLRQALFGSPHDIIFLAGHFSASSALAADFNTRVLASDLVASDVDLTNSLVYSAGCHSGYNVVDDAAVPNVTQQPDWAQAFAQKKAMLIAGTGYQYGDTDVIEYSERLYLEFTKELRTGTGPVAIGQALVRAKQNYLAATPQLKGIHQKALEEATLFGLPMMTVDMPGARLGSNPDSSIVSGTTPFTTNPGQTLGLTYSDVNITPSLTLKHTTLNDLTTNTSIQTTYFEGTNGVVTNPTQPVLPLESRNVTVDNTVLRGVGFRSGTYSDLENIIPLTGAPATEIRGVHVPYPTQVFFPNRPWNINYFDTLGGGGGQTRLLVTPAQYKSYDSDPLHGTWRTYDSMQLRLFYSSNALITNSGTVPALSAAPSISNINATSNDHVIHFSVHVVGNPSAGIQQVWVTYTGLSGELSGKWQSLDLAQDATDSTLWVGTLTTSTVPQDIRFIVQAVNGVGLTTLSANLGAYYTPDGILAPPGRSNTALALDAPSSGSYGSKIDVSATLTSGGDAVPNKSVWFGIGAQRVQGVTDANGKAQGTLSVFGLPGDYQVQASFEGDTAYGQSTNETDFAIVKENTTLTIDTPASPPQYSDPSGLTATVRDSSGRALGQVSLAFVLTGDNDSASRLEITNLVSTAELGAVPVRGGTYSTKVSFGKTVTLSDNTTLNLTDSRYNGSSNTASLIVNPETATVEYTGDTAIDAGADLELSANVTQQDDGSPGDITKAKVKYEVLDSVNQVVASQTGDVGADGKSTAALSNVPGGTYTLKVTVVGGYFSSDPVAVPISINGDLIGLSQSVKTKTIAGTQLGSLDALFKSDGRFTGFKLTTTKPKNFNYIDTLNNTGNVPLTLSFQLAVPSGSNPPATPAFCLVTKSVQVFNDADLQHESAQKPDIQVDTSASGCPTNITVNLTVPASAKRYIKMAFTYAGNGATGFDKSANRNYAQGFLFSSTTTGDLLPQSLPNTTGFAVIGKNFAGVGGFALNPDGTPRVGYTVRVKKGNQELGSAQTDTNGFFAIHLPVGGPYKVQLVDPNTNQVIATANVVSILKAEFETVKFQDRP